MFKIKREARILDFVVNTFPFILPLSFVHSPIILRSFFDSRTEIERRINGGWTENERNSNGTRTELERSSMRKIYHRNCWADCNTVSLLIFFQKLIKIDFGTYPIDNKKPTKSCSTFVGFQPSTQQNKRWNLNIRILEI